MHCGGCKLYFPTSIQQHFRKTRNPRCVEFAKTVNAQALEEANLVAERLFKISTDLAAVPTISLEGDQHDPRPSEGNDIETDPVVSPIICDTSILS